MRSANSKKGFSLIEILIVVAVATSIVLVVSKLGSNTSVLNTLVSRELQSKADIEQTLQIVTTEIRSASPSASGAFPLISAATSSFSFYSNGGNNGVAKRVHYYLATSTIYRGVVQPTGTPATYPTSSEILTALISGVVVPTSSPLFTYYDTEYTGTQAAMTSTADVTAIRLVKISFSATVQPAQSPAPEYFSRFADIRNLRSN